MPPKDGLSKKNGIGVWSFLYYLERWYLISGKYNIFYWTENEIRFFSRNTCKNDIFCIYV